MPGWIIQGVRGEGKSLAAVGKIREYLERGRPVATNLNLNLEKLVNPDNRTPVYRLPDHPRSKDFHALPPAYDSRYKPEDRNGLLVLDESIIWLNGRNYKQNDREALLAWLLLSRKDHWDLILLAQDHEAIDKTARSSLCDYIVQASRSDRTKQTLSLTLVNFFKTGKYRPLIHRYDVFYGSFANPPSETWEYTGSELYDAYDTNQKFVDGMEAVGNKVIDFRALYTMLPAAYLTKRIYLSRHEKAIDHINAIQRKEPQEPDFSIDEGIEMAQRNSAKTDNTKPKLIFFSVIFVLFLGWRISTFSTDDLPGAKAQTKPEEIATVSQNQPIQAVSAIPSNQFIDNLLLTTRPRLSAFMFSTKRGTTGIIDFYNADQLVERFTIKDLHAFGVAVKKTPYGVELITSTSTYPVTSWPLQQNSQSFSQESDGTSGSFKASAGASF